MTSPTNTGQQVAKHPIQPLELDDQGLLRFKANAIVDYCVKEVGLNKLAAMFRIGEAEHADDWNQLAQLIGYSHSGPPSCLSQETWYAAKEMHEKGISEHEARARALRDLLDAAEDRIAKAIDMLNGDDE